MADIKDMSREEIENYLASMPKDTTEPSAKQEATAAEVMRGADGNYNINKINLSKMFADKANEHSYIDEQGNKKSYNKGTKWLAYIDKNITDPAAKADMEKQIYDLVSANPNMSDKELKFRLRAIQSNLIRRYPNGVSKKFDISGGMLDRTMAKELLKLGLAAEQRPVETKPAETSPAAETKPAETSPAAEKKTEPTKAEQKPAGKHIGNTNKDVANAQVGDYIVRKDGSTYVLKQADIDWAKKKFAPAAAQAQPTQAQALLSDDDAEFMKKYKGYTQQLSGVQPRDPAGIKQLQESEPHKFITDPANKKRYQEILKKKDLASKSANKQPSGKTPQQQMLDKYHEHH